jgi:MATE family multidrug resistance protein
MKASRALTLKLLNRLNHLYWPILCTGSMLSLMPFINTIMMGHLGTQVLAAGGLVNTSFIFIMVFFWGIFSTLTTLVARYRGEDNTLAISKILKSSLSLALMLGIITMLALSQLGRILIITHQPTIIVATARPYILMMSLTIIPDFILVVLYDFFFGLGKPRIVMWASSMLIPINILLNYVFMYGKLGLPALGIAGLGLATLITYSGIMLLLLYIILSQPTLRVYLKQGPWFNKDSSKELIHNGIPVGLIWIVENGFFTVITFLMGIISINALAAFQIAFQTDTILFTLTSNMGQTIQIMLSENLGGKNYHALKKIYWLTFGFLSSFLLIASSMIWVFPQEIVKFFLGPISIANSTTATLAVTLLKFMPYFLLLDSFGFLTFSALRAFSDTRFSLGVVIIVYWIILIPLLMIGVIYLKILTPEAIWLFLCLGSLCSFILQFLRFHWRLKQTTTFEPRQ